MNDNRHESILIEPERYEFFESPFYEFELKRRDFFKLLGAGLLVCSIVDPLAAENGSGEPRRFAAGKENPPEIGAWIHIGENDRVTVYVGKAEMGQNIRTSITQVVAEELLVPLDTIHMVMGDTDLTPYDAGTFGSRTTPYTTPLVRNAAAAAREWLLDLVVEKWKVDRSTLTIQEGKISHAPSSQSIRFGELTQGRELMKTIQEGIPTRPADQWKVAGNSIPKVDGMSFVTGKHRYVSDIDLPDMQYGKILRPPAFEAERVSLDSRDAEAVSGVTVVQDGNFVGVTAPDSFSVAQVLKKIKVEWKPTSQPSENELVDWLRKNASQGGGRNSAFVKGSVEEGMANADRKLEQTYTVAYIAHAPLEPRAAVAQWTDGKLTVWTGTQRPYGVQGELMKAFGLPNDRVRVIMPDTGSGYGGKHTGETAIEAARLAKTVGKPVKVVWTREEEFTWAYFRPAGVIDVNAGVTLEGKVTAWEFQNINSGGAGIQNKYDFPNQRIEFHPSQSPLRQGSYRCLAATANHFARESFMDELAHAVGMEPLEFRLKNIQDERLRNVLQASAEKFGWGNYTSTPERGFGLACGFEKESYMAICVEIAIDPSNGEVRVVRVVESFDCGPVINPDHLKNQIEGMIMMGLGGALFEAIHFENGKILNPRFSRYRVPRFRDLPKIETVLIDRKDIPSAGGGETPIVGIAPAVGNAIFKATGKRIRSLPMVPNGLKAE